MNFSVCAFCHGDRGAIGRSRMPIARRDQKDRHKPHPDRNDVFRRLCPGICLGELTGDPFGTWASWGYACDAKTGVWKSRVKTSNPMQSGMTPTAGGVVFFGDMGGNLYEVDATDGQKLWGQKIGAAIGGGVITYTANGTQKPPLRRVSPKSYGQPKLPPQGCRYWDWISVSKEQLTFQDAKGKVKNWLRMRASERRSVMG